MPLETTSFAAAIIDALSWQICVVDRAGVITAVNRAWRTFSLENGGDPRSSDVGAHYLRTCQLSTGPGADEADEFGRGLRSVLEGRSELFELEYPCHSPSESRWFLGRVTPLGFEGGGAVISHLDITDRKSLEFELARVAATDPLTGLPNRRYFLEAAAREVDRVYRLGGCASVMMIDLDHFKSVNDTHGHAVGDDALRRIAHACRERLREIDILARLGGEEFVVILPDTDVKGASHCAQALCRVVSETPIETKGKIIHLTASFGVSQILPQDPTIHEALARADLALYEAKRSGRDCVKSYAPVGAGRPPIASAA